jgi:quercetin dioxygenase-like cupin family protein
MEFGCLAAGKLRHNPHRKSTMKARRLIIAALAASVLSLESAHAQEQEIQRTDLVRNDISVAGKEVIQTRVDFNPGATAINHKHPGEEIAFVLEGVVEYWLEGREPTTLKAGQSLFIPAGIAHSAKNVGTGKSSELATYVVTKGAVLVEPVQ